MNAPVRTAHAPLGEIAAINPVGPGPRAMLGSELVDFVPMAAVREDGGMSVLEQRTFADVLKGYTPFQSGDVLIAKITPCFQNNKIALAEVSTDWAFGSTEFHVVRPHADVADARYLTHFLRQDRIRAAGEKRMTGSGGQRRVPKDFLESLPVPLPSLDEQRQIAAILDQADALRRLRRRALDRLNGLRSGLIART